MRLSDRAMRQQITSAVNLVIQVARLTDGRGALFLSLRSPAWKAKRRPCRRSSSLSAPAWMHPARSWGDSGLPGYVLALPNDSTNTVCNYRCSFRRHSQDVDFNHRILLFPVCHLRPVFVGVAQI